MMKGKLISGVVLISLLVFLVIGCKEESTIPTISTVAISNVQTNSAMCGGVVKGDGGEDILSKGVCWSTLDRPTTADNKTEDGNGNDDYTSQISNINPGTSYYVRAYATNSRGTAYGNTVTFTTGVALVNVVTSSVSSVTSSTAASGGNITSDGGYAVLVRGVCWGVNPNPTITDFLTSNGSGIGSFVSSLTELSASTKYYVRAYATSSVGTFYGPESFFTTLSGTPGGTDNDNMLLGNPSGAVDNVLSPNNYLMVKPQYCLSYNNSKRTMNWTSWHLYSGDIGSTPRQDDFRPDNTLPTSWYHVTSTDFQFSTYGFDRGHMCPSADRTSSVTNNSATFLMTNMIPQAPYNNQQTWGNLEDYSRTLVSSGNELYIVSGPYGEGGTSAKGTFTVLASGVVVPSQTWKIILVLPNGNDDLSRITTSTRVIAVWMPNVQTMSSSWASYRTSVDYIESQTGYDFLSNVPAEIQSVIEAKVDNL